MQVFLVGDPVQLPATVLSGRADKHGYSTSLFKRLQTSGFPVQVFRHSFSAQDSTSVIALVSPKGGYACKVMWHSQACTSCSQAGLYITALASLRDSLCRCWTPSTGCTHAFHNSQQPPSMLAICAMERAWKPAPPAHGMSILCVHSCFLSCRFVLSDLLHALACHLSLPRLNAAGRIMFKASCVFGISLAH